MNENRIGTYSFIAEPFHVDFTGRLTLGVLGNHLLKVVVTTVRTTTFSAGFGIKGIMEV